MKINAEKFCEWLHDQMKDSWKCAERFAKEKNYVDAMMESESIKAFDYILDCIENNPEEHEWIEE